MSKTNIGIRSDVYSDIDLDVYSVIKREIYG